MTVVFSDTLMDLRQWLRKHPDLKPLHSGRVFLSFPKDISQWPSCLLYRSGGGVQAGEAPEQDLRISLEVWGKKPQDYDAVRTLVTAIESAFHQMQNNLQGGTLFQFGQVTTAFDSPAPEEGEPRYVLDVLVTCRAA